MDHQEEEQEEQETLPEDAGAPKRTRTTSTIEFPYIDLEQAAESAKKVFSTFGVSCNVEQFSGVLNVKGGALGRRIHGARVFGLIERDGETIKLTDLGRRIADASSEASARAEAFLKVELYHRIYEDFKGNSLPGDDGIQNHMKSVGVPEKQTEVARQVFRRSAKQGGFFQFDENRLISPPVRNTDSLNGSDKEPVSGDAKVNETGKKSQDNETSNGIERSLDQIHPSLVGMIRDLPKKGDPWENDDFEFWTQTFLQTLRYAYKIKSKS